jgi:hypothetical protein
MRSSRAGALTLLSTAVLATAAHAQEHDATKARRWSASATAYQYLLPDDADFLLPLVTADRGALHLEGRYNYEEHQTASLWAGWTFSLERGFTLDLTPMAGAVFGHTNGVAPGVESDMTVGPVNWYAEAEQVFDLDDSANNFLYLWSELSVSPREWFRAGLVGQRLRTHETGLEVERGLLIGVSHAALDATLYAFNLGTDARFTVISLGVHF